MQVETLADDESLAKTSAGVRRFKLPEDQHFIALYRSILEFSQELSERGVFNMLMSDGRQLYAFCSTSLVALTRRSPFGAATLIDEDLTVDFSQHTTPNDIVSVIATRPLTRDERWAPFEKRSLAAFSGGKRIA